MRRCYKCGHMNFTHKPQEGEYSCRECGTNMAKGEKDIKVAPDHLSGGYVTKPAYVEYDFSKENN